MHQSFDCNISIKYYTNVIYDYIVKHHANMFKIFHKKLQVRQICKHQFVLLLLNVSVKKIVIFLEVKIK